jgi:hypothetical protein
MTEQVYQLEIHETSEPYGVAKTSPELADELRLAPLANLKGRAVSEQASTLVSFLDSLFLRPSKASAKKATYRPGKLALQRQQAIAALLAELLIAAAVEEGIGWLRVSLDKRKYNRPSPVSWRTFEGIRYPWKEAGLLEEIPGFPPILAFGNPGPPVGRMSRFKATPRLLEICKDHDISVDNAHEHFAVEFDMPSELVQLTRPPMPTRDTTEAQRLRDEVASLNAFFAKHRLEGARHVGWVRMFHGATTRHQEFNKGGRLYSQPTIPKMNYQQMPRDKRIVMTIDGEALSEIDISGSYLTIFYAAHGQEVNVAGAYDGILGSENYHRAIIKTWVNASFGNGRLLGQWSADLKEDFAKKYRNEGWQIDPKKYPVARVRELTLARHSLLASWGEVAPGIPSSYGDLMYHESQVIISTMVRLAKEHLIPSAPVHDSILVPRSKVAVARRVLEEQFKEVVGVTPLLRVYPEA